MAEQHKHRDLWLVVIAVCLTLAGGTPLTLWGVQETTPSAHIHLWPNPFIVAALIVFALGLYMLLALIFGWWLPGGFRKPEAPSPAAPVHAPTFWKNSGTVAGNEITNTYNAPEGGQPGGNLIVVEPGAGISESLVSVEYGDGTPAAPPDPLPSTPDERIRLRDQLLTLADAVEAVMATWGQSRQAVAAQMGVPPGEFMTRMTEILSERSRIDDEATARYNDECRSAVVQAYGHARSIGVADAEMERIWTTRLGVGASGIPACLRGIAARMLS